MTRTSCRPRIPAKLPGRAEATSTRRHTNSCATPSRDHRTVRQVLVLLNRPCLLCTPRYKAQWMATACSRPVAACRLARRRHQSCTWQHSRTTDAKATAIVPGRLTTTSTSPCRRNQASLHPHMRRDSLRWPRRSTKNTTAAGAQTSVRLLFRLSVPHRSLCSFPHPLRVRVRRHRFGTSMPSVAMNLNSSMRRGGTWPTAALKWRRRASRATAPTPTRTTISTPSTAGTSRRQRIATARTSRPAKLSACLRMDTPRRPETSMVLHL